MTVMPEGEAAPVAVKEATAEANMEVTKKVEPIWFASYPAGVPRTIDPDGFPSLSTMLIEACRQHAARPAFESLGARMTYAEWERDSKDFAAFLIEQLGCRAGDRVALMLPNMLAYPVAFLGTLRAGLIVVNVNPLYTPRELAQQLADCGAEVIVILENFAHKLQQIIAQTKIRHVVVARLGDFVPMLKRWAFNFANLYIRHAVPPCRFDKFTMLQQACERRPSERYEDARVRGGDIALLQYTGGTTGEPKGAMLTHRNLIANTLQCWAWTGTDATAEHERVLTPLPLYHIFSLTANLLSFALLGGMNILIPDPRDLHRLIRVMRKARITWMSGVNTLFNALVNVPEFATIDFSDLRVAVGGGAAIQSQVAETLARDHRQSSGRRLWLDRGVAGGLHHPVLRPEAGHGRATAAVNRGDDPRRPRHRAADRRSRRDLRARPASDARLLAASRTNQAGAERRRLAAYRRYRRVRSGRFSAAARPQEGHDQRLGPQSFPERGRRCGHAISGRARSRCHRRPGSAQRRDGQAFCRAQRSGARQSRTDEIHACAAGGLQSANHH